MTEQSLLGEGMLAESDSLKMRRLQWPFDQPVTCLSVDTKRFDQRDISFK